jgi:hypothetical protein
MQGCDARHPEINNFNLKKQNARDAIRTHEPLQEWILSPSELAGLSYPRALHYYPSNTKKNWINFASIRVSGSSFPEALGWRTGLID